MLLSQTCIFLIYQPQSTGEVRLPLAFLPRLQIEPDHAGPLDARFMGKFIDLLRRVWLSPKKGDALFRALEHSAEQLYLGRHQHLARTGSAARADDFVIAFRVG